MRFRKSDAKDFAIASPADPSGVLTSNFRLQSPNRWQVKDSITLIDPSGQASIIASSMVAAESRTLKNIVDEEGVQGRAEFANYRELSLKSVTSWNGIAGFERVYSWQAPDGAITQVQRYFLNGGRRFTITATSHSENFDRFEAELRSVLQRFSVGG